MVGAASHLAQIPREAGETQALEAVDLVLAAAAVQTRRARALVDVPLAVLAGEAGRACAPVSVHQVLGGRETGSNMLRLTLRQGVVRTITVKPEHGLQSEARRGCWV